MIQTYRAMLGDTQDPGMFPSLRFQNSGKDFTKLKIKNLFKHEPRRKCEAKLTPDLRRRLACMIERLKKLSDEDPIYLWEAKSASKKYVGFADPSGVVLFHCSDLKDQKH